jgi:two-component system response regulator
VFSQRNNDARASGSLQLGERLGVLERGAWYSAFDEVTGEEAIAAVVGLDEDERRRLDAVLPRLTDAAGVTVPLGVEHRDDGNTYVFYAPDDDGVSGDAEALTAEGIDEIGQQLRRALAELHRAGFVHGGISRHAIAVTLEPNGDYTARLRGVGIPALPGRTTQDDELELAELLLEFVRQHGSARPSPGGTLGQPGSARPSNTDPSLDGAVVESAERAPADPAREPVGAATPGRRWRILLVASEPHEATRVLQALGRSLLTCSVEVFEDGGAAIAQMLDVGAAGLGLPDLLLLDLDLARGNPFEVIRKLRDDDATRFLPIIALIGSIEIGDIRRACDAGASSYVRKPSVSGDFVRWLDTVGAYWLGLNTAR